MNIYYYKITGINIPLFWKNILKMALVPLLMTVAGLVLFRFVVVDNWFVFFAGVIIFTVIYAVLMYFLAFNSYEKDVFRKPLKKVVSKFHKNR